MSKQNWIEIYKFHVFYVTFVAIKLNSLFQYFSSLNTSCSNNALSFGFSNSNIEQYYTKSEV